jgi:nicotinic acid phosphoribosyltransferase
MADITVSRAKMVMAVVEGAITAATVAMAAVVVEVEVAEMTIMEVAAITVVVAARMVAEATAKMVATEPLTLYWPRSCLGRLPAMAN